MRKITGYIGAMIVVFALAGSILAGYALNINGTTTIINEYDKVTDVSGLYTHSDEKNYIDYSPASNYVSYSLDDIVYTNTSSNQHYKNVNFTTITITTGGTLSINNYSVSTPGAYRPLFICDGFLIQMNGTNDGVFVLSINGQYKTPNETITITLSGDTTTLNFNGVETPYTPTKNLVYWGNFDDTYDYCFANGRGSGNNSTVTAYFNDVNDIISTGYITPSLSDGDSLYIAVGNSVITPWHWDDPEFTTPLIDPINNVDSGIYSANINYDNFSYNGDWGDGTTANRTLGAYYIFYPRTATSAQDGIGIDYTVSSRVNNYPINYQPSDTVINADQIDLMSLSAENLIPNGFKWNIYQIRSAYYNTYMSAPIYTTWDNARLETNAFIQDWVKEYRLSDILSTYTIPAGANTLTITTNSTGYRAFDDTHTGIHIEVDENLVTFRNLNGGNSGYEINNIEMLRGQKSYAVYDINTGVCSVYNYSGTLLYTATPDNIAVLFCRNNRGVADYCTAYYSHLLTNGNVITNSFAFTFADRPSPFISISSETYNPATVDYVDITKGIKIKDTNNSTVGWNNNYENGVIDIVFRADDITQTYHNELTVSNNTISADYTGSRFYITLNNGAQIDIGTWRSIVLNIDLINGKLNVIPVRTFNSFTNVITDNTKIFIGDLYGATPTNKMSWGITTNSLQFGIYSTSVFMDTYGVVMVNPMLDITNYFTDLNDFYRLKMTNFAVYGDSITINNETLNVINGNISYDGETLELRNLTITYADGVVTLGDSHTDIELGEITSNTISMSGSWYFLTELERGYTAEKLIYDWNWGTFIFDNTQFCIFYLGIMAAALIIARKYCSFSIMDYAVLIISIVIALGVQVIA